MDSAHESRVNSLYFISAKSACFPTESPIGILEDRRIFRISSHLFLEMSKVDHQNSSRITIGKTGRLWSMSQMNSETKIF